MVGVLLAVFLGCQFLLPHGGLEQRTSLAPSAASGETTLQADPLFFTGPVICPKRSTREKGITGLGGPSLLEPCRTIGADSSPVVSNGLAMQEVPDPAVGFQRALLQVRTALEQSLASTYAEDEAEISQQDQSQCLHKRGKGRSTRRRFGSFLHTDTMDCYDSQLSSQHGDQCYSTPEYCGNGQIQGGEHSTSARTSATISTCSRSSEALGTSTWFAARYGHLATRVGAEVARSRGQDGWCRHQAQSRASQQDAKSAEAGDWHHGEDSKARPGLADLCGSGGGEVSQTQRPFLGNQSQVGPCSSPKVGRAGHYQGRDLPGFSVFDECPTHGRVGRPRHRRQGVDGIPPECSYAIGGPGRLPGHGCGGRRNRGADQIYSGSLPEGRSCDLPYQSGKGAPQTQGEWKGQTRDSEELNYGTWDEIDTTITIPVSCCVQDVFSGLWSWVEDDELHYTKDNSDLRSGAKCSQQGVDNRAGVHVEHPICMNDTLPFDVHNSTTGVERCMQAGGMTQTFVDNGSDTELALGENGANDASIATMSCSRPRQVRFNPEVEVCEFEPHFEFLAVDDVLPSIDALPGDGVSTYHFTSEADAVLPPPVGDDMVVDDHGAEDDIDDDAYVVFHGFGVLETSTAGLTVSPDEPLRVITYGIHGVSLGRRDTWVTTAELPHLKQRLWELWEDAVPQFATCWAFAVRPQPLIELQVARAWVILVEIDPSTATPPGFCAALLLMCNEQGAMFGRPLPKLVREDTTTEAMVFQHPHSRVCVPDGMRECKLMVEGSLQAPHAEVHVRPGALSKLLIADAAPAIQQAQFWYPDVEQMAVEALALQRSGLETFQLVLHHADRSPREFDVGIM